MLEEEKFNEETQMYFRWTMNFSEFASWLDDQIQISGEDAFNETFPTFEEAYKFYRESMLGE